MSDPTDKAPDASTAPVSDSADTAEIINFPGKAATPEQELKSSERRWGKPVMKYGFHQFPALLFEAQNRLQLGPVQFNLLLQILSWWWRADDLPFPALATIADRMGMSERQVRRVIRELEANKLIKHVPRKTSHGQRSNYYDPSGVVERLKVLEPEFSKERKARREARKLLESVRARRKAKFSA
jgi:AraC-like DNA-binding protein